MEKLILINWKDKRSKEVQQKLVDIDDEAKKSEADFSMAISKVHADESVVILCSFNPENFKV